MKVHVTSSRKHRGFSLLELMIVIAVIAIRVGVVIPALHATARAGNEAAAIQTVDTIRKLQAQYSANHEGNFAPTFDELIKTLDLDSAFSGINPVINGYVYKMDSRERTQSQPAFYSISADPQVSEGITRTGERHFYFDSTLSKIQSSENDRQ